MPEKDKPSGMKSAYEAALERLESQGIELPQERSLSDEVKEQIAEARRKAEARLAEMEILHRDRLRAVGDPVARDQEEDEYRAERRRIEEALEREIEKLRG